MRSALRKELLGCFRREFESRFPQFALVNAESRSWTWAWKMSVDLTFFVVLQALERWDQFVIEAAWSQDGEFPWGSSGNIDTDQAAGRARLGQLWEGAPNESIWDLAFEKTKSIHEDIDALARKESPKYLPDPPIEQILPRVGPLVHDAVNKLEQYGIPLFHRVANARPN